ncbi:MAG: MBL fold metallo-hydrolase [Bacteroidota bacterium]
MSIRKTSANIRVILYVKSVVLILLFLSSCQSQNGTLSPSVSVVSEDDVNGVLIRRNNETLVIYGLPQDRDIRPEHLLLTHCRRDLLWTAGYMIEKGVKTSVPAEEYNLFTKTDSFWQDFSYSRFEDYDQQTSKYPTKTLDVSGTFQGGDLFHWQDLEFEVLQTPGYTRGAISYISRIDGKKIAFTGDLIYGDGQLLDLYSLQDRIPELEIWGYHGFASRMAALTGSLQAIKALQPDIIVPSRGPVIKDPDKAIDMMTDRLQRLYANYLSTTAFRWYTGDEKQIALAERMQVDNAGIDWMPMAATRDEYPAWLQHVNNSVLIRSETGATFLIDCGEQDTYRRFSDPKEELSQLDIDGIFITHYHNDHTEFIPALLDRHQCPVYTTEELRDILENPGAYRMPAMTRMPIHNIRVVPDRHTMQWNEFKFTFYNFPGQTIYHNAMLVESKEDTIFFIGDSFSPSGIDDYCLQNRNILETGQGYYYCLEVLRKMPVNTWLVNQHIHTLFSFPTEQLDFMEQKLKDREEILAELSPWEAANYLIDEQWVRYYPYGSSIQRGEEQELRIIVKNHQTGNCTYRVEPGIHTAGLSVSPGYQDLTLPGKKEDTLTFTLSVLPQADTGLHVLTADISYDDKHLHEWCEAMIEVQ